MAPKEIYSVCPSFTKIHLLKLLHDSSGLSYVKDRLFSCASKSPDRIAQNPLVEEAISSNKLSLTWGPFSDDIICGPSCKSLTKHACLHNSYWGSRCDSSHARTISLKPAHFHGDFGTSFQL